MHHSFLHTGAPPHAAGALSPSLCPRWPEFATDAWVMFIFLMSPDMSQLAHFKVRLHGQVFHPDLAFPSTAVARLRFSPCSFSPNRLRNMVMKLMGPVASFSMCSSSLSCAILVDKRECLNSKRNTCNYKMKTWNESLTNLMAFYLFELLDPSLFKHGGNVGRGSLSSFGASFLLLCLSARLQQNIWFL